MNSWGKVADEGFIGFSREANCLFHEDLVTEDSIPTKTMTQRKGNKKIRQIKRKEKDKINKCSESMTNTTGQIGLLSAIRKEQPQTHTPF